jgi:hypothetical protein
MPPLQNLKDFKVSLHESKLWIKNYDSQFKGGKVYTSHDTRKY